MTPEDSENLIELIDKSIKCMSREVRAEWICSLIDKINPDIEYSELYPIILELNTYAY